MSSHEGNSTNKAPLFNGTNFAFWKVRMRTYIMALGADVWDVVDTGYVKPVVLANKDDKLEFSFNAKAMNAILSGLAEAEFVKVMHLGTAKEMWDKLINSYEGNEKVKDAKLQTYRIQFEQLKMKEDETVGKYFLRVEEMVNAMKALGETIGEPSLVQKILRSLPDRFNPKVSAIEELNDLKTLQFDQLLGTLTAYEMRIVKDKPTSREASFKADKNEDSEPDEIEAKFVKRLKKGSGKYKGKLPFKCFNCGRIGHFANKCPHKGKDQTCDDEEKYKHINFFKENNFKKKSLCANNDDDPSDDEDNDSSIEDKLNDFTLMAKEDYDNNSTGSDVNEEEAVVDMEGELISALEEIDRLRIKNRKQRQLLIQFEKDSKEPGEDLVLLKVELEEAKKIEEILKQQLLEKKARCESLEQEVVKTRKEMEKFQALYNQNLSSIKASEGLTTILNQQRNPKIKTGLGYEEGSSSEKTGNEEPIKFVKSTTNDNNKPVEIKEDNQQPRMSKENGVRTESVGRRNNVLSTKRRHQQERNQFAQRRQPFSRYKEFFYGYCFYCSNFGHKAVNCSLRPRNEQLRFQRNKYFPQQRMIQSGNNPSQTANCQIKSGHIQLRRARNNQQSISRQHCNNKFDLLNNEVECYTCHNFGHKSIDCRLRNYEPDSKSPVENVKFWKKKESNKCGLVLSAQRKTKPWYIDSGCSKHMTGDKGKFLSLSESKSGTVTFGNDAPGKIKGKGMVSLSNGKGKAQDVLLVDGLKHNLLSVSQMCDRGCEVLFTSKDCKIKSVNSGQVVAKGIRT
jgi:hypothetical protein